MGQREMSKELFCQVAAQLDLDVQGPHLEQLYQFTLTVLRSLKPLDDLRTVSPEPGRVVVSPQEEAT